MKNWWFWSFERGSFQYDLICGLIIAFIAATPVSWFNDRPDFMRLASDETVRAAHDDEQNAVYTVRVDDLPAASNEDAVILSAIERLRKSVERPFKVSRAQAVHNTRGSLVAYALWISKEEPVP